MIRVKRSAPPSILKKKAEDWLRALLDARTKAESDLARNRYRHGEVKKALIALFHGKCAYCESKITHVDCGHIEHYRPKSGWKDLTFDWSNLLLACGICNGAGHKGNRFPESDEDGPIVNPCEDEPLDHFKFDFDQEAMVASVYGTSKRGKVTESVLGLNRSDLRVHRSLFVKRLIVIAEFAKTNAAASELLKECVENKAEYAAFARALIAGKR